MILKSVLFIAILAAAARHCDVATGVCFSETRASDELTVRIAIPSDAAQVVAAPFDALLQLVAPKTAAGWAAIAWGGKMTKNPLTVAWANGNTTVVSSRWADTRTPPASYPNATYTVLKRGSSVNATHWTLTALCERCSSWTDGNNSNSSSARVVAINPDDKAAKFAFALAPTPPSRPADPVSPIAKHTVHGAFTLDLAAAKTERFDEYVKALS
ncbi:iron reductase domain protein [Xylariaceae sp. FL0594]|nr:iron reductase domain protein [Xylariaceae sp. FL0594]